MAFWSTGFEILTKYGSGIRDCIYGWDAGFDVITKQDPGNRCCKAPRSRISDGEIFKINSTFVFGNHGNDREFKLSILHHANMCIICDPYGVLFVLNFGCNKIQPCDLCYL